MKIELKRIQHFERMSQETHCYAADIWVDGKKVGTTENQGHGGPDNIHFDDKEVERRVLEFAKTIETEFDGSLEIIFGDIINKFLVDKQIKGWCRNKTVLRMSDQKEGEFSTFKMKFSPQVKEGLTKKYGDKILEFVNERFI